MRSWCRWGPRMVFSSRGELVRQHWQEGTVGAMVASPTNPTGGVLSKAELLSLAQAVREKAGYLVVDEIYHGLGYGVATPSVLEVDDDAFVINSFSKYFGMTGWRLGWLVAPSAAVPELEKLAQNLFISIVHHWRSMPLWRGSNPQRVRSWTSDATPLLPAATIYCPSS